MATAYSIGSEHRGAVEVFSLRQAEDVSAEVAPALGNNCFAFQSEVPVLEPVPFEAFCEKPTSYGIPTLFPWPNRIRDGVFRFEGRHFAVQPNRHGFVRDKPWTVLATGTSGEEGAWITSSFEASDHPEQILDQFPFPFRLEVTFRLRDGVLFMETWVRNVGTKPMLCGFGIHPYFRLPEAGAIQVPARSVGVGGLLPHGEDPGCERYGRPSATAESGRVAPRRHLHGPHRGSGRPGRMCPR